MTGPTGIRNSRISEQTTSQREHTFDRQPDHAAVHDVESGSMGATITGGGAVVLAILGLIGLAPGSLASIALIAAGFGVLVSSSAIVARYQRFLGSRAGKHREVASGMGTAALGGLGGVTLGILGLLQVAQVELISIAPIVIGAGLLIGSAAAARFEQTMAHEDGAGTFTYLASGADALIGAGAVVLGILALSGSAPVTLSLVATLGLGAATLMGGTSIASQMFGMSR